MTIEPLDDDESTAWRALMVFWRQGLPMLEGTFRRVGLNHLEYGLLAVLSEQPDGAMSAGELAALAGVSTSRLAHRLKQLEADGHVARRADPHDGRAVIVAITAQGQRTVDELYSQHLADVRALVFDRLTHDQTVALADSMTAVASGLTDHPFLSRRAADRSR